MRQNIYENLCHNKTKQNSVNKLIGQSGNGNKTQKKNTQKLHNNNKLFK